MTVIGGAVLNAIGAGAPFMLGIIFAALAALFFWGGWPGRFIVLAVIAFLAGVPYSIG